MAESSLAPNSPAQPGRPPGSINRIVASIVLALAVVVAAGGVWMGVTPTWRYQLRTALGKTESSAVPVGVVAVRVPAPALKGELIRGTFDVRGPKKGEVANDYEQKYRAWWPAAISVTKGETCEGVGAFNGVREGVHINVYNVSKENVGVLTVGPGRVTRAEFPWICSFEFSGTTTVVQELYSLTVDTTPLRGQKTSFPRAQANAADFWFEDLGPGSPTIGDRYGEGITGGLGRGRTDTHQ